MPIPGSTELNKPDSRSDIRSPSRYNNNERRKMFNSTNNINNVSSAHSQSTSSSSHSGGELPSNGPNYEQFRVPTSISGRHVKSKPTDLRLLYQYRFQSPTAYDKHGFETVKSLLQSDDLKKNHEKAVNTAVVSTSTVVTGPCPPKPKGSDQATTKCDSAIDQIYVRPPVETAGETIQTNIVSDKAILGNTSDSHAGNITALDILSTVASDEHKRITDAGNVAESNKDVLGDQNGESKTTKISEPKFSEPNVDSPKYGTSMNPFDDAFTMNRQTHYHPPRMSLPPARFITQTGATLNFRPPVSMNGRVEPMTFLPMTPEQFVFHRHPNRFLPPQLTPQLSFQLSQRLPHISQASHMFVPCQPIVSGTQHINNCNVAANTSNSDGQPVTKRRKSSNGVSKSKTRKSEKTKVKSGTQEQRQDPKETETNHVVLSGKTPHQSSQNADQSPTFHLNSGEKKNTVRGTPIHENQLNSPVALMAAAPTSMSNSQRELSNVGHETCIVPVKNEMHSSQRSSGSDREAATNQIHRHVIPGDNLPENRLNQQVSPMTHTANDHTPCHGQGTIAVTNKAPDNQSTEGSHANKQVVSTWIPPTAHDQLSTPTVDQTSHNKNISAILHESSPGQVANVSNVFMARTSKESQNQSGYKPVTADRTAVINLHTELSVSGGKYSQASSHATVSRGTKAKTTTEDQIRMQKYTTMHTSRKRPHNADIVCGVCHFKARYNNAWKKHVREMHWESVDKFVCKECIMAFKNKEEFVLHVRNFHPKMLPRNLLPEKHLQPLIDQHRTFAERKLREEEDQPTLPSVSVEAAEQENNLTQGVQLPGRRPKAVKLLTEPSTTINEILSNQNVTHKSSSTPEERITGILKEYKDKTSAVAETTLSKQSTIKGGDFGSSHLNVQKTWPSQSHQNDAQPHMADTAHSTNQLTPGPGCVPIYNVNGLHVMYPDKKTSISSVTTSNVPLQNDTNLTFPRRHSSGSHNGVGFFMSKGAMIQQPNLTSSVIIEYSRTQKNTSMQVVEEKTNMHLQITKKKKVPTATLR